MVNVLKFKIVLKIVFNIKIMNVLYVILDILKHKIMNVY